jgi:chemosensory pili system protein ChpC
VSETETESVIASLYLPVSNKQLLLPNVSVAEVVTYQEPKKLNDAPEYFLGMVHWRGIDIPVVSYELANGLTLNDTTKNARIAVINTIGKHKDAFPFFAIITQGLPRLVKVSDDIIKKTKHKVGVADAALIKVDGEDAIIPNLDYLESLVYSHI